MTVVLLAVAVAVAQTLSFTEIHQFASLGIAWVVESLAADAAAVLVISLDSADAAVADLGHVSVAVLPLVASAVDDCCSHFWQQESLFHLQLAAAHQLTLTNKLKNTNVRKWVALVAAHFFLRAN